MVRLYVVVNRQRVFEFLLTFFWSYVRISMLLLLVHNIILYVSSEVSTFPPALYGKKRNEISEVLR